MSKEIKLLSLVSYHFLPPKMGGQKGIALFYEYLCKHLNITCVTLKDNDTSFAKGYEVLNILSNNKWRYIYIPYFFTLKKLIQQQKITHVIIEHPYYGWLGILLKWFCKVKLIVHSHNIEALRFRSTNKWWWRILWSYEKFTHRRADANFFIHDNDKAYAINKFKLDVTKCFTITYGFELKTLPALSERLAARKTIEAQYKISSEEKILLFNGTLNYAPNLDAVDIILKKINPLLLANRDFNYKIIICGKNLPVSYNGLKKYSDKNIIYAGFVDDITAFLKASDIFINPVIDGGGIKTKVVEALGYNLNVITTKSGATGIPVDITHGKMKICEDRDWQGFTSAIIKREINTETPAEYFEYFYWGNIVEKAYKYIDAIPKK